MWSATAARRAPTVGNPAARRLGFHLEPGMAVGLYGGSFHPAHGGHGHVAETALKRLGLDRVIWLVSPQNPLKAAGAEDNLGERCESARAWANGPRMIVSDAEAWLSGRGPRYTVDTVRWFKARFRGVRFVWIMGADNLAQFHRWRGWASLMREIPIAVVSRPGVRGGGRFAPAAFRFAGARVPETAARRLAYAPPPAWIYLTAPYEPVSSTALRNSTDRRHASWYAALVSQTKESPLNRSSAPEALALDTNFAEASRQPRPLEAMILGRLDDEKAQDIVFIDLTDKSSVADGLVIASGRSHRHVGAIADHLLRAIKGQRPRQGAGRGIAGLRLGADRRRRRHRPPVPPRSAQLLQYRENLVCRLGTHRGPALTLKVTLLCVARLGATPEGKLALDYAARATASGRSLGLGPIEIVEVEGRKPGKAAEAVALLAKRDGGRLIACDEHAPQRTSREIADWLAEMRDGGERKLAFAIGGADGLGDEVLRAAADRLAFGPQTWPHALARVMMAEQIYRAVTILAGAPYHRD